MNSRPSSVQMLRVNRAGLSPLASRFVSTKAAGLLPRGFVAKRGWRRGVLAGCVAAFSAPLPAAAPKPAQANWNIVDHRPTGAGDGALFARDQPDAARRELKACHPARPGNSSCTNE